MVDLDAYLERIGLTGRPSISDERGGRVAGGRRSEKTPAGSTLTAVDWSSLPGVLSDRFGLPGFSVGPNGELRES